VSFVRDRPGCFPSFPGGVLVLSDEVPQEIVESFQAYPADVGTSSVLSWC
jgi:hypothetical protein